MTTAKAAVVTAFDEPLVLKEVPIPTLRPGEVLVRILAAGVCGSDVHMWRGQDPRTPLPITLGHEGVGQVVEIGGSKKTVDGLTLHPGDLVIWNRGVVCGHCYWCAVARQPALCPSRWAYGIHRSFDEGAHLNGCYADHLLLHAGTDILPAPPGVGPELLVAASCSGATTAHAFDLCPCHPGDTVLIQGVGPLGAFAVAFARAGGAGQIIVIGGTDSRLELCRGFGATTLVNRRQLNLEERQALIMDLTNGRGVDLAIEASGTVEAFQEAPPIIRVGGAYAVAGIAEPRGMVPFEVFRDLARKNLHLQGVWVSDTRHLRQAVSLVTQDPASFAALVTHRFSLPEATRALETVENRSAMKAVIVP
ncbi:MAG: zinc-binding dehydrogenase [Bacteroidetes bacterium]|nr:zinc-binding dehydrogenase [Bacteroidota bacterium]